MMERGDLHSKARPREASPSTHISSLPNDSGHPTTAVLMSNSWKRIGCTTRRPLTVRPRGQVEMKAFLVHGMGRTPASQFILARRLRAGGFGVRLFGYSTLDSFESVVARLTSRVQRETALGPFVLVGHSLGCVIIRAAVPRLVPRSPLACYFLAPPSTACRAARIFATNPLFTLLTGEMGRCLANEAFMASLPVPQVPIRIYAGTAGPRGALSPFGHEENDGILAVSETIIADAQATVVKVPALHTFIMNSPLVASDLLESSRTLQASAASPPLSRDGA